MYDNLEIFWSCYCIRYLWWNVINPKDHQTKKKYSLSKSTWAVYVKKALVFSDIQIFTIFLHILSSTFFTTNFRRFHDCSRGSLFARHFERQFARQFKDQFPQRHSKPCIYVTGESSPPCDGRIVFRANEPITILEIQNMADINYCL